MRAAGVLEGRSAAIGEKPAALARSGLAGIVCRGHFFGGMREVRQDGTWNAV